MKNNKKLNVTLYIKHNVEYFDKIRIITIKERFQFVGFKKIICFPLFLIFIFFASLKYVRQLIFHY